MNVRPVAQALKCLLALLLFSIPAVAGEYRTVEVESLRVTLDSEWSTQTAPGYWPVRFDITNLGEDRVIEIYGRGDRWWRSGEAGNSEIRQTLRLKRGDRQRFTIPVPVFGDNDSVLFQIRERGRNGAVVHLCRISKQQVSRRNCRPDSLRIQQTCGIGGASWLRPLPLTVPGTARPPVPPE
jgi:hypothetical protein